MKSADLIKDLRSAGCELKRQGRGSHQIWYSPITGKTFPVTLKVRFLLERLSRLRKQRAFSPLQLWRVNYVVFSRC